MCLSRHGPALLLQRVHGRDGRGAKRRRRAEEERRHRRDAHRERQETAVNREVEEHGIRRGRKLAHEDTAAPRGDHEPTRSASAGKHHALREQVSHEPPTRGTERKPHAEFVASRGGACQQQIGDVHTGDQQHERDDHHDRQ
jgi:hypothetical protein